MTKKAKRKINRSSWKKTSGEWQVLYEQVSEELSAERDSRASEKLALDTELAMVKEQNDVLAGTIKQVMEEKLALEKGEKTLVSRIVKAASWRIRLNDRICAMRKEIKSRRQISAVLASFHLPGMAIEDAYEQFMDRSQMIGYEPTFQLCRLTGEAYKTASRLVLDCAFNRGGRLSAPKTNNEGLDGVNPIEALTEILETEIGRSRREVMERMRRETRTRDKG